MCKELRKNLDKAYKEMLAKLKDGQKQQFNNTASATILAYIQEPIRATRGAEAY